MIYINIRDGNVVAEYRCPIEHRDVTDRLTSVEQLNELVRRVKLPAFCSSSLDFPDEFTSDPQAIALARAIRGENVDDRLQRFVSQPGEMTRGHRPSEGLKSKK